MTRQIVSTVVFIAVTLTSTSAFTPSVPGRAGIVSLTDLQQTTLSTSSVGANDLPYFLTPLEEDASSSTTPAMMASMQTKQVITNAIPKKSASAKPSAGAKHSNGIFTPIVLISKKILGEETLNKVRGKVIAEHSNVIGGFVDTAETTFGTTVLKQLFNLADKDKSGTICANELKEAMLTLGFDWIQEKQVQGIFARADRDGNGAIDINEWIAEAPKTLRTNLIKLAKKNGGELGFLS